MANQYGCYESLDICAVRASRLTADGSLIQPNTNGSAYDLSVVSLGRTAQVTTGDRFEQKDGCGRVCAVKENADTTTGEELTLELCNLNIELLEILTGAEVILDPGDATKIIGFKAPDPSATKPVVEFNAWAKAYDSDNQVGTPRSYWHWVWPSVQWNIGDWTLENGFLQVTLTGKATSNNNIKDGSFNDFPELLNRFFNVFLADDIPDPDVAPYDNGIGCGYVDTPADDS